MGTSKLPVQLFPHLAKLWIYYSILNIFHDSLPDRHRIELIHILYSRGFSLPPWPHSEVYHRSELSEERRRNSREADFLVCRRYSARIQFHTTSKEYIHLARCCIRYHHQRRTSSTPRPCLRLGQARYTYCVSLRFKQRNDFPPYNVRPTFICLKDIKSAKSILTNCTLGCLSTILHA